MHSPFVGAYWPSRRETKEQCALHVADFFARIEKHSDLSQWFTEGKSAKTSTKAPVPVNAEAILPFLKTNNRDTDGSAIAELGFNLNLWNGSSVSLSITCGAFASSIRNSVLINLPSAAEVREEDLRLMRSLLEAIIDVWTPSSAVATSPQLMAENGRGMPWQTRGWYNYSKSEGLIAG